MFNVAWFNILLLLYLAQCGIIDKYVCRYIFYLLYSTITKRKKLQF